MLTVAWKTPYLFRNRGYAEFVRRAPAAAVMAAPLTIPTRRASPSIAPHRARSSERRCSRTPPIEHLVP